MTRRARWLALGIGIPAVALLVLIAVWRWDWFIPLVESRVSAAIGRPVHVHGLSVDLGRITTVSVHDIVVDNPPAWDGVLARIDRVDISVVPWAYIWRRELILPSVVVEAPHVWLLQRKGGDANYHLGISGGSPGGGGKMQVGGLVVRNGAIRANLAEPQADFTVNVATRLVDDESRITAVVDGAYSGAPIAGSAEAGSILSFRDPTNPWPVEVHLRNGETRLHMKGTVQDPMNLAGVNLALELSGQDMSQLEGLAAFPLPRTPPFQIAGQLDYAAGRIVFRDFKGLMGRSDLSGDIEVDPLSQPITVMADVYSQQVDLADLAGMIGAEPGRVSTPGQSIERRARIAEARSSPGLLPDTPISLPKLDWANVHVRYRGQRIRGQSMPLDNLSVVLDIEGGVIKVHPVSTSVGRGALSLNAVMTPDANVLHTVAKIEVNRIDVSKLMAATGAFGGTGVINGSGTVEGRGRSVASILTTGNGGLRLGMSGGDLSALLVNLSGLQFGNAVLSALGLPQRTRVDCMVADLVLRHGVMGIQTFVLDTGEGIINATGTVDLRTEALDLTLRTEAKRFTVGSLPTPVNISGSFKNPAVAPGAELAARGGAAAALGAVFPPLALLPTIQFGTADDTKCERLLSRGR